MRSRLGGHSILPRVAVSAALAGGLLTGLAGAVSAAGSAVGESLAAVIELYAAEASGGSDFPLLASRVQTLGRDRQQITETLVRARDLGVRADDLAPLLDQVLRLSADGMPVRPVLSRYLQGLAKGVPVARIRGAAETLEIRLRKADEHLRRSYPEIDALSIEDRHGMIDHVAYALEVGVRPETLDRSLAFMGKGVGGGADDAGSVRAPILALSFLVYAGVDDERSFELVSTAWDQGYRGANLERLGETVVKLGTSSGNPDRVVNRVLDLLGAELSPDRVFQDLDALAGEPAGGRISPSVPVDDPTRGQGGRHRPDDGSPGSSEGKLRVVDGSQSKVGD